MNDRITVELVFLLKKYQFEDCMRRFSQLFIKSLYFHAPMIYARVTEQRTAPSSYTS